MKFFLLLALSCIAIGRLNALAAEKDIAKNSSLHIQCDLSGMHEGAPNRIEYEREMFLVEWWLHESYPYLPEELKSIAERTFFLVNHSEKEATKIFMGWSAEDDSDWRGDRALQLEGGSIKINLSERAIQLFDFAYTYIYPRRTEYPDAWQSLKERMFVGFLAHELTHEAQYMARPARDLRRFGDGCPDGLCDKTLIAENELKVQYELEGLLLQFSYFETSGDEFFALYEKTAKEYPDAFSENGKYGLLGAGFKEYYMRAGEYAAQMREAKDFVGLTRATYSAQTDIPKMTWAIKELNDTLEALCESRELTSEKIDSAREDVDSLVSRMKSYSSLGERYEDMKKLMSYIQRAEDRFEKEIFRFNAIVVECEE